LPKADNTATGEGLYAFYVCYFVSLLEASAPGYERKGTWKKYSFCSIVIEGVEDSAEIK